VASRTLVPGGGGANPNAQDWVRLRYIGWTPDGAIVDSSFRSGLDGIECRLCDVNAALATGVRVMTVGEKRRFWLPMPKAAVSGRGTHYVFDLELMALTPTPMPC
jgi:FKBP-type peptidyl-prolyl cis-trans isomerase